MLKEISNVLNLVRPRHLLKALLNPREELLAFKYHYRRVSQDDFVSFLAGPAASRLNDIKEELSRKEDFHRLLREKMKEHPDGYGGQMTREAPVVYALVRLLRPRVLVETGVADGFTTSHILQALEDNGVGKLYSVDLPHYLLPTGRGPGWMVEERLRSRWELRVGDAALLLPPLLGELGPIDMFLHDSLHTYDHMMMEFRAAWRRLAHGGLFLSHDVGQNRAFMDFMSERSVPWRDWRVFHVLGGTIRRGTRD